MDSNFYIKIEELIKKELSCSAHDLSHVYRVYNNACYLAKFENNVDMDVIKTAALLHDIARVKEDEDDTGSVDHASLGADMAEETLLSMGCDVKFVSKVKNAILTHRFKGENIPSAIEDKIIYDADKLDIIGAVGLGRSFMIVLKQYGQQIYNDSSVYEYVRDNMIEGRIKDIKKHTPNIEFQLKVKKMHDKLFTLKAKEIAKDRISFMEEFYSRMQKEINLCE